MLFTVENEETSRVQITFRSTQKLQEEEESVDSYQQEEDVKCSRCHSSDDWPFIQCDFCEDWSHVS